MQSNRSQARNAVATWRTDAATHTTYLAQRPKVAQRPARAALVPFGGWRLLYVLALLGAAAHVAAGVL